MKELLKKLEGKLPENEIVKDADMKRYTSFKAGGKADVLVMPETQEELMYLLQAVNAADVSYMIMGNGTNSWPRRATTERQCLLIKIP